MYWVDTGISLTDILNPILKEPTWIRATPKQLQINQPSKLYIFRNRVKSLTLSLSLIYAFSRYDPNAFRYKKNVNNIKYY